MCDLCEVVSSGVPARDHGVCVACKEWKKDMHVTCALYKGFPFEQLEEGTSGFLCPSHIVCLCVNVQGCAGV